jgi:Zn-dependent protease with chaperone function
MTRTEFEDLVKRLEPVSRDGNYRFKVALLAAAGYGYILAVLVVLALVLFLAVSIFIGRGGGVVLFKLAVPVAALAFTVLRALWVRWPEPEGIPVTRAQAPKLFDEVEAIRKKLDAPTVHRVFVNDDFNAALEQRPRLGIFGWPEGILHLGLPLMHALSPEEFRAVLAHEMGHLSGNHGRLGGWIYRIRETWSRLLERLEAEGRWGSGIFTKFLHWYAPFLNAYSFVLARAQEYEADRCAAEVVGKDGAARTLVAMSVRGKFLDEKFWPALWKGVADQDRPPADVFQQQKSALEGYSPGLETRRWLAQSLSAKTGYIDTHPSLHDRLSAVGASVSPDLWATRFDGPEVQTAADTMLGNNVDAWYRVLSKNWTSAATTPWKDRYYEVQEQRKRLAELRGKETPELLNDEEAWETAALVGTLEGDEAALPLWQNILQRNARHVSANYTVGRILIGHGDATGLSYLSDAMKADSDYTFNACYLAEQFLREQGLPEEAERYRRRAMEYADLSEDAEKERINITAADSFSPHGLDEAFVNQLRDHLRHYQHLQAAHFVRKQVKLLPEKPAFVLGIVPRTSWYRPTDTEAEAKLFNGILQNAPLPAGAYVVLLNSSKKALRKVIEKVPGGRIYG